MTCDPEQQLLAIERDALHVERVRLAAAEDLLALVDQELAAMQRTLNEWPITSTPVTT